MPLVVRYHAEDHLPGDAVAILEPHGGHSVDIYMSRAYPLDVVATHLSALATAYCRSYDVEQLAAVV